MLIDGDVNGDYKTIGFHDAYITMIIGSDYEAKLKYEDEVTGEIMIQAMAQEASTRCLTFKMDWSKIPNQVSQMVFFKKDIRYRIEIHREVPKVNKFKRIYVSRNCDGPSASLAPENFEIFHLCGLDVDTNLKFAVVRDNGGVIDILTTKVSEIMNN